MTGPKLGLIVNPVAGIGGRVGLKGSDGVEVQRRARALGAVPQSLDRAVQALERLRGVGMDALEIVTCPREMGEDAARACGFAPTVLCADAIRPGATTAADTIRAAREMQRLRVDLLLFAGGDGTARDIYTAVGSDVPALGIPAGVKIHSAVYAAHPAGAGELAALALQEKTTWREAEVMDVDEAALRQGVVSTRLYGVLRVPFRRGLLQGLKTPSGPGDAAAMDAVAAAVVRRMDAHPDALYVVGPGSTTRAIAARLGLGAEKTLIGVDVIAGGRIVAADVNEDQLLALLAPPTVEAYIVVTPIGGQGFLFGRGNQPISPRVIACVGRERIIVVSTPGKIHALGGRPLRVDTSDRAVDEMLSGYVRVTTGYGEQIVYRVAA